MIPKLISLYLVTPDWEGRLAIPAKKKATSAKYELRLSLAKRSVWVGAGADSKERSGEIISPTSQKEKTRALRAKAAAERAWLCVARPTNPTREKNMGSGNRP